MLDGRSVALGGEMQQQSLSFLLSLRAKDASGSTKTPSGLLDFQRSVASDATYHAPGQLDRRTQDL